MGHPKIDEAELERLIDAGHTIKRIAIELGVTRQAVIYRAERAALGNKLHANKTRPKRVRPKRVVSPVKEANAGKQGILMPIKYKISDEDFFALVRRGLTAKQIAIEAGITRQAVSQRARNHGMLDALRANKPPPKVRLSKRYGIPLDLWRKLSANGATMAYYEQKKNANYRGIGWEFTLATWWAMWDASGKWALRGRGNGGYVMGRFGDSGPYAPWNVEIVTNRQNVRHYWDTGRYARLDKTSEKEMVDRMGF